MLIGDSQKIINRDAFNKSANVKPGESIDGHLFL